MFGWFKKREKHNRLTDAVFQKSMCPVCRETDSLLAGPEGGISVNAMCDRCGTRLNLTPAIPRVDWTHGPQPIIWGGGSASVHPSPKQVKSAFEQLAKENR